MQMREQRVVVIVISNKKNISYEYFVFRDDILHSFNIAFVI
jgi:hypothetical protein